MGRNGRARRGRSGHGCDLLIRCVDVDAGEVGHVFRTMLTKALVADKSEVCFRP